MPKLALAVFPLIEDLDVACQKMVEHIDQAAEANCSLIVFPEATLGGIDIQGKPEADISKSVALDSVYIEKLRDFARKHSIGVGFGFLEKDGKHLYDGFLLLTPDGETSLHYRRISPGWLTSNADQDIYLCGKDLGLAHTPWGKIAVLICGDLFMEELAKETAAQKPDLVLHILARAYPFGTDIQKQWDELEFPWYLAEYAKLDTPVAVVNVLDGRIEDGHVYCGGAWFIKDGKPVASKELMTPGLLFVDLP